MEGIDPNRHFRVVGVETIKVGKVRRAPFVRRVRKMVKGRLVPTPLRRTHLKVFPEKVELLGGINSSAPQRGTTYARHSCREKPTCPFEFYARLRFFSHACLLDLRREVGGVGSGPRNGNGTPENPPAPPVKSIILRALRKFASQKKVAGNHPT